MTIRIKATPSEVASLNRGETVHLQTDARPKVGEPVEIHCSVWPLGRFQVRGTVRSVYNGNVEVS